jgi:Asp-tRNA(Asn)/Glu-tRNA(Gln) amidotransferase A subunit family amidase
MFTYLLDMSGVTGVTRWPAVRAIAAAVRSGEVEPRDLVERALAAATAITDLRAVVHLDADGARACAAAHRRKGSLAGVPVLVKEIIEVEGWPFRCGSEAFADRIGVRDAEVVGRLRVAGAIPIGLTHSHEFAYGCTSTSNRVGPSRNPHDATRMTGGSSGGAAAAVAAGVVPFAIGTDTAGSVRIPAALCGVVGAKPANGTIPAAGVFPLSQSLDTVGVLATSVADAGYTTEVLSGTPLAGVPHPPRLGVVTNPEHVDHGAEVGDAWTITLGCLRGSGATLVDVKLPDWDDVTATALDVQGPEAAAVHAGRDTSSYQPDVQERLREAASVPGWRYVRARAHAAELTATMRDLLRDLDAVLMPMVPIVAPPLDATAVDGYPVRNRLLRNTRLANLVGLPAISLPMPADGLPAGLQVIAAHNSRAFATATWIESRLGA